MRHKPKTEKELRQKQIEKTYSVEFGLPQKAIKRLQQIKLLPPELVGIRSLSELNLVFLEALGKGWQGNEFITHGLAAHSRWVRLEIAGKRETSPWEDDARNAYFKAYLDYEEGEGYWKEIPASTKRIREKLIASGMQITPEITKRIDTIRRSVQKKIIRHVR